MKRWIEKQADASAVAGLVSIGVQPLIARLLAQRGITADSAADYFAPDFHKLADPFSLPGIDDAVETIVASLQAKERIVVFGDYDCDGVCATAILTQVLRRLCDSKRIVPFLPNRLTEGYGMTDASLARMFEEVPDAKLVITVDNGINSVKQVQELHSRGVKVVVTDHHLRGEELPEADALVNPRVAAPEALADLCGAAVAYFLASALVDKVRTLTGRSDIAHGISGVLFTLAGLATVTDIMPLTPQNRILVAESLRHFARWAPVGLRELHARAARTGAETMTSRDFGFILGPRINAVGRLSSAMSALDLVLCPEREREKARQLALSVDLENMRRRKIEQGMTDAALARIADGVQSQVISFASSEDSVHPGVAGIVASRVLERLSNPVPVCVVVDGKGSARAPEGYNVRDALAACSSSLNTFGGHAAAAGLAIKPGLVDTFRKNFAAACAAQAGSLAPDELAAQRIDAWVSPKDLTVSFAEEIARMEPFGEGNEEPVFALSGAVFASGGLRPLGANGQHLHITFRNPSIPRAIWWNHGEDIERLRAFGSAPLDILFTLSLSDYGQRHVDLRVIDIRPSSREQSA